MASEDKDKERNRLGTGLQLYPTTHDALVSRI